MKMAFLWCVSVIGLSLFAMKANAQLDSNAMVRLYCGQLSEGCDMDIHCQYGGYTLVYSSTTVGFDSSIRLADIGRWGNGPWQTLAFSVDFGDSEITNLTITNGEDVQVSGENAGWAGLSVVFPLIPFHYVNGVLEITPGKFQCYADFGASCQYGLYNPCSGSCSNTDTIMDSVFFEIAPPSEVVAYPIENSNFFRAISIQEYEFFSFNPECFERNLQVYNVLGENIFEIPILSGQTQDEMYLPPGCYLARLGDQVAKFIVPPR